MAIFRFIFSIIFAPVRWLTNLLTQRKDSVLEWHLNYGPSFVKIQTIHKEQFLADDLLIAGYILFLAQYFYICDERQVDVVRNFLLSNAGKQKSTKLMGAELFEKVFNTLTLQERDAVVKLSRIWGQGIAPGLPFLYSEDEEPRHSFAKYKFLVFERPGGKGLGHIFHMSAGPDIILLPLTVGILYEYVVSKLRDKDKKEKLDNSIIDLLEGHSVIDCRSMAGLTELPNEVIRNNNLLIC